MTEEDKTEELLVYMDFNTKIEDVFFALDKEFKIIGLESQGPILQLGNQVFQGEWRDTVGTYLFFEEETSKPSSESLFSENFEKTMKFCWKTDKLLHMSRIFLKPNTTTEDELGKIDEGSQQNETSSENMSVDTA